MRRNYFIWAGVFRDPQRRPKSFVVYPGYRFVYPTVVIDVDLASWALPFAIHGGGPLLGKPGFHFRILCLNIGWSKL